jgi:hypothetical protein
LESTVRRRVMAVLIQTSLVATCFVLEAPTPATASSPFTCSIPVDPGPIATVPTPPPATPKGPPKHTLPTNAISYLFVEGKFQRDFSLAATMTLPLVPANVGGFYSNWLMLIPLRPSKASPPGANAFIQLELIRWGRYDNRNEIGLTWAGRDGHLIFRDTGLFVDNGPHRLEIAVKGPTATFLVDRKTICHAPVDAFFDRNNASLYYQVGTEVLNPGEHVAGEVYDLAVKNDGDTVARPYEVACVYRGYGTAWEPDGPGRFRAEGVFDPTEPFMKFEGPVSGTPCKIARWKQMKAE